MSNIPIALRAAVIAAACFAIARGSVSAPVAAQGRERSLYVSVFDAAGKPVTGLSDPAAFIVREDGVAREVLRVGPATAPMQIALIVDNTQAAAPAIVDIRQALSGFLDRLGADHEVALISLAERPTIVVDYTKDRAALKKGAMRFFSQPSSGAYLLDTLYETARGLTKREAPRPVIIAILVDGPEFGTLHHDRVLEAIAESGAALHTVMWTPPGGGAEWTDEVRTRNVVIDRGTSTSGGRRDDILASLSFPERLGELAAELAGQHLVVYARPERLVPPSRVEIGMARPGLTARGTLARAAGSD
jgi:hypothetical protein